MLPTKRPEIWTCLSQHSWWFKCSGVWVGLSKIPSLNDFSLRPLRLPQGLNCLNKPKLCSVPWGPQHLSSLGKNSKCTYTSVLATGVSSSWFLDSNLCHNLQSFPSSEGQRGGAKSAANPDYRFLASEMMSNNLLCLLVVVPTFSRKAAEIFLEAATLYSFKDWLPFADCCETGRSTGPFSLWEDAPRPPASHNKKQTCVAHRGQRARTDKARTAASSHFWLTSKKYLSVASFLKEVRAGNNRVELHTKARTSLQKSWHIKLLCISLHLYKAFLCLSPSWQGSWFFVLDAFSSVRADQWLFRAHHTPSCIFFSNFYFTVCSTS